MSEKHFYHSFPRSQSGPNEDWPTDSKCIESGISILELISKYGLLMTPESWEIPPEYVDSGPEPKAIPIYQQRVCFTATNPGDLLEHSKCFGPFSLEFELSLLRRMGAMPVIYLAPIIGSKTEFGGCSISLLHRLTEIHSLMRRMNELKQCCSNSSIQNPLRFKAGPSDEELTVRASNDGVLDVISLLERGIRDADMLRASIDSLVGLMYPSENSTDELLEYFQEREWRITNSFVHSITGKGIGADLSVEHKEKLKSQNPLYFNKQIEMKSGPGLLIDSCNVISEFVGKPIIDLCTRVIVPDSELEKVKKLLPQQSRKIVSLESLINT